MPKPEAPPTRSRHALARTLAPVAVLAVLAVPGSSSASAADVAGADDRAAGRPASCAEASVDPADFPRVVPLPQGEYTVRGYLRSRCRHLLDLAMEVDDLGPEQSHLVQRLTAKRFRDVTSTSRTVEVDTGPDTEPELREEFKVRARGHGYRVRIELSFVGAAPRWSGTALVRYVVRPLG
ncbi:hypothetical protein EUA93_18620 [Nocardioides oleivorans]|uniref:Uncharacterized protein n=1 Tax=Nocardioides oleivorans TaxID=273676 RepID=A0A4Q2RU56_9ACTN|nr:hypothetical protein [Nocardioides oleivorans]RYB90953.1 hypothetical protein EUA93_18620 [Nocardioides oleivorans]